MKPAPFDYVRPSSMEEACAILAEAGGGAQLLAGGQTLMPLLALRMSQPFILVDITHIAALRGVTSTGSKTRIGAITRQNEALADPILHRDLPPLIAALGQVGHHQTRNRGTIGGSIALGEPAAEMPAVAVALGAEIALQSVRGQRMVRAEDFYHGPYATAIDPDEIITAIHYPAWPAHSITLFREVARRPGDFALVGLVGALVVEEGIIVRAGIAWFGMGATPIRARQVEAALTGARTDALNLQELAGLAIADTAPFDDHHATADYRRTVGRNIFISTLSAAAMARQMA
ncbi:FAD binding domain-containing protein [Sphingobium sp. AP49]|uniref:FAD binding domain-containing protein n=1 Tax=Sphingobium sp. AP49 TaxID=1144307 RepID=UPI00026ED185|nr:FAD binding domain-containing protein [Sphingobium sp. AP49]WHO38765.1 FAD binding domain-containing protein [Sphingobium sp. AP49]